MHGDADQQGRGLRFSEFSEIVAHEVQRVRLAFCHRHSNHNDHFECMFELRSLCQKRVAVNDTGVEDENRMQKVSSDWHTAREHYREKWKEHGDKTSPHILTSVEIHPDGGLNDKDIDALWHPDAISHLSRCMTAFNVVVVGLASTIYLVTLDLDVILGTTVKTQKGRFLLTGELCNLIFRTQKEDDVGEYLVCIIELAMLLDQLAMCFFRLFLALCSRQPQRKWRSVSCLFWTHLPFVSSFTAMKLLHFVAPVILIQNTAFQISKFVERFRHQKYLLGVKSFLRFMLLRLVYLIIGYDAFLIKVRVTMDNYINQTRISFAVLCGSWIFLFQVLGILNLTIFVRARLFQFIFGGPDCIVDSEEKATQWLWKAMLVKRIWERHSKFRFFVIMFSFSDLDFQGLMLRPKQRNSLKSADESTSNEECEYAANILQKGPSHVEKVQREPTMSNEAAVLVDPGNVAKRLPPVPGEAMFGNIHNFVLGASRMQSESV